MLADFKTAKIFQLTLFFALAIGLSCQTYGQDLVDEAVGGIRIDSNGLLQNSPVQLSSDVVKRLSQSLKNVDADLRRKGMRVVSLKQLEQIIVDHKNRGEELPLTVRYMAGMQRIEYVMISPENGDVLVGGPAEGLTTDKNGSVVGVDSGMPAIQLQDFLVAMRSVQNARTGKGISVSIDPTQHGIRNVQKLMKGMRPSSFTPDAAKALEEACGPQDITLTGVPKDSRFSQVLVAADYKMKRLAMGLEPAPEFLPSILAMAQQKDRPFRKMSPRFWMETSYEPVAVSDDKSVWKLNGQGVCTKTMEEYLNANGRKVEKANKVATKWANDMTENFDKLSEVQPVFRELRNLMDISVVAAIIAREQLLDKVNLQIPTIQGLDTIAVQKFNVPQKVPTQCSYARLTRALMVTTSGGVKINSWSVAANSVSDSKLNSVASHAIGSRPNRWWWNVN